mgnify:FL=1
MGRNLDDIDRKILSRLQRDARNSTAQEIADSVGVSASTVRNRIALLEADGVIRGYHPEIDYEEANIPLKMTFVLSVPPTEMADYSDRVRRIPGVIDLREMVTGRRNLYVDVVTGDSPALTRITDDIHDLGVEIESSELMRRRRVQPFDFFSGEQHDTNAHTDDETPDVERGS